ncbi:enolase C-terminal domain-like protein [Parapedobacter indicus]|uniref:Enolase C-terminal domain-like n=1 Tax=Parapedobacter indicus TaxID=1477437 RepID=A0A1I3FR29_9SPHI|nr:enolase C-terminal domain-like protein [Parapedobacter indicus]PPL03846.1 enolase-like protein [Parapedobacter indicus]SFI13634.1 Enolase C-terminal domain-like [Parapedobacter indicus]
MKQIRVVHTAADFEREKLLQPFGFKGGYLTELWQVAAKMKSEAGHSAIGLATQSVLYGDANLFARSSEAEGNALMFVLMAKAMQRVSETRFSTPIDLMDTILPQVHTDAQLLTGRSDVNLNFVYNALVSVDNSAWLLYAVENGYADFDHMVPEAYRPALASRNKQVGILYQVSYNMSVQQLKQAAENGYFLFKIKTGYPGSQEEMLQKDMERLTQIHEALKDVRTDRTSHGKVWYTLDANARYEKKETLMRYLDHARRIGAFAQILFYEEPLAERNDEDVHDVGIRIAADESAHDEQAAVRRIEQGYGAIVLKGIAKTLTLTLRIAKSAHERNIPCLCADLTVNPILVDWHKNLAARLPPFPDVDMALMETNGDSNYVNWAQMSADHPYANARWTQRIGGAFELDDDFYEKSGGIFVPPSKYSALFGR